MNALAEFDARHSARVAFKRRAQRIVEIDVALSSGHMRSCSTTYAHAVAGEASRPADRSRLARHKRNQPSVRLISVRIASAFAFVIAVMPGVAAQQFLTSAGRPVDPDARFEAVAIKAVDQTAGPVLMRTIPGRFESNLTVAVLLRQAFQKPDYRIVGAPGWSDSERYSITAKVPEGLPPTALSVLLTNLLKDRFHLTTHLETRELPVFNLVMARSDGRLGPDIKITSAECQATIAQREVAAGRGEPPPPLPQLAASNAPVPCGSARWPPGGVVASGRTIAELVTDLADLAGRVVIDRTGLTGRYDLSLRAAYEGRNAGPLGQVLLPLPSAFAPPVDSDAPNLFTAVQEQLGLRLETARARVEVIVIDRLEKAVLD
jgi:uncharacterized protein (TIGR03435 family)